MTTAATPTADRLVDVERGIISREIFVNDGIFADELEKLFARAWLFVGHESQIPQPGDYFTSRMGSESVILCRDKQRNIHVFLNTCRHRGMKVCRYDQGNTPLFTCPYHNWSFSTDGRLVGVPMHKELYSDLDRSAWSLIEVPRMVNYKGAIFASWDRDAPDFVDCLGDAKDHLDQVLDCRDGREGGSEVFGGVHKWIIPANWKFAAENFQLAGERAFSAGADIHEMAGLSSEELARRSDTRGRISWHIASYQKPLIGAINGLAYGGAALLSSSLDLRIGCERTQFRFLAASYGRVNSTWSLPALVGVPKAKELLYTGRVVPADEAKRIGLLNQIVPAAKLIESALEMGQMIAKNDARMVQGIKRLLHEGMGLDWQGRYDLEDEARATYLAAGHPRDGFKDFLARKPAR